MLPGVGVFVVAFVGVEGAVVDVGRVLLKELEVFGGEMKKVGVVGEAEVGWRGGACGVVCEVEDAEVHEAEGDVG